MSSMIDSPSSRQLERRLGLVSESLARTSDPLREILRVDFRPFDSGEHLDAWRRFAKLARAGRLHPHIVLYVHIPFCAKLCTYCLLSALKSPGRKSTQAYVGALRTEMALYAPILQALPISAVHIGGGTPTLLAADQLDDLLGDIEHAFERTDDFRIDVEAHPSTASREKLEVLARRGVDRVSFGVETFTPQVLENVNRRDQTDERVAAAVESARACGIGEINIDLLAGLPGETVETFSHSVRRALDLRPDALSVNRFISEQSLLSSFGYAPTQADTRVCDEMLLCADRIVHAERPPSEPTRRLERAGYGAQYIWDRTEHRRGYSQQDMIGPASVLAIGHGALGHLHQGSYYTTAGSVDDYVAALANGHPPPILVSPVSMRFEIAFCFADQACRGQVALPDLARVFGHDVGHLLGPELSFLRARGLLAEEDGRWRKPDNRDFQVTHLIAFLSCSTDKLAQLLAKLPTPSAAKVHPAERRTRHRAVRVADVGDPEGATDMWTDLIDADNVTEAHLAQAIARLPGSRVSVWTRDGHVASALAPTPTGSTVGEVVVQLDTESLEREGLAVLRAVADRLDDRVRVCAYLEVRDSRSLPPLDRIAAAGARQLILDLPSRHDADHAVAWLQAAAKQKLTVEVLPNRSLVMEQYRDVDAEHPPSLLWCRIAMIANATNRRLMEPALVRL